MALALLTFSGYAVSKVVVKKWHIADQQFTAEMNCIQDLVKQGTQRIDIATKNGKCWEEKRGYYK